MIDKKKPHTAGTGTASKTTSASYNHIESDPLTGWFSLAKSSRINRQQKRGWQ